MEFAKVMAKVGNYGWARNQTHVWLHGPLSFRYDTLSSEIPAPFCGM